MGGRLSQNLVGEVMEMGRRTEAREAVELPVELGWEGRRMRVVRRESRVKKAFCSVGDVRFDKEVRGDTEELRVSGGPHNCQKICLGLKFRLRVMTSLFWDVFLQTNSDFCRQP